MTRYQNGKRAITGIAEYCAKRERIAELRNQRWLKLHWQEVQALILEAFYGAETPLHSFRLAAGAGQAPVPKPKTTYQLEALAAPFRKVVAVFRRTYSSHGKQLPGSIQELVLECGHRVQDFTGVYAQETVTRRRCKQCVAMDASRERGRAAMRRAHA